MPEKHNKYLLKKYSPHCKKKKPIKIGKRFETTHCLGCKDYTQNFRPQEVKMTNKILREKSRFLKQKIN